MGSMPALQARTRWLLLAALVVVQAGATAAIGWRAGTHIEEIGGLMTAAPMRLGTGAAKVAPDDDQWRLRASQHLPVWGLQRGSDGFVPLMVDGHIGALPFTLHRWANAIGGLRLARSLSWLFAGLLLVGTWMLGRALGGPAVAWLAALMAALSPHVAFMHHWARADEQLSAGLPVLALLALIRQRSHGGGRWLVVAGALLGVAMAAKNTAAWLVAAMLLTGWLLDVLPRCPWRTWALAVAAACLPLTPQLAYVLVGADTEAFWQRLSTLPGPEVFLEPQRLVFFAGHFATSFGALGDYVGQLTGARVAQPALWATLGGGLALVATLSLPVVALSRRTRPAVRLLGCGLGLALLQYVALYYEGMSLFGLLGPWVPLAMAVAAVGLSRWLAGLGVGSVLTRGLPLTLVIVFVATQAVQGARLQAAFQTPRHGIFSLHAQKRLVELGSAGEEPTLWTTTYGLAGVPELLSDGRLRGRHLFPVFWDVVSSGEETHALYDAAWRQALDLMPSGRHRLVLVPQPASVEVSPCRQGHWIAGRLPAVLAERGVVMKVMAEIALPGGAAAYSLVEFVKP